MAVRPGLRARVVGAALLAALLASVPLLTTPLAPLHDFYWHLARMRLLADPNSGFVKTFFEIDWAPIPNLAMDVLVPLLARFMPLAAAGSLFIAVALALIATGAVALHAAWHRRWSFLPLLASLLLHNWFLRLGFVNYLFGLGLMLWMLALYIRLQDRSPALRLAALGLAMLLLYACHFAALGLFGAVAGTLAIARGLERRSAFEACRELALLACAALGPLALLLAASPTADQAGQVMYWWSMKVRMLFTPAVGERATDLLLVAGTGLAAGVAIWRGWLRIGRRAWLVLGVLAIVLLAVPYEAFGSPGADTRLPLGAALIACAILRLRPRDLPWQRSLALALAGLFVLRVGAVTLAWHDEGRVLAEYRRAFERLAPGSVLFTAAVDQPLKDPWRHPAYWHPPVEHVGSLAMVWNTVLVPQFYAHPGHQPVHIAGGFRHLEQLQLYGSNRASTPDRAALAAWLADVERAIDATAHRFPAVYAMVHDAKRVLEPPPGWRVFHVGETFVILIATGGAASAPVPQAEDANEGDPDPV